MDYSKIGSACQAGEQKKSNGEIEIDHDLAKFIASLPVDFGRTDAPIVEAIDADKSATTPTIPSTPEPKETGPSRSRVASSPVTGTTAHTSPIIKALTSRTKTSTKPRWRDLGELDKLQASVEAAEPLDGLAWSLNLGIGREWALLNHDDPARLLSQYISREFRRAIGHDLPYSFAMELCRDNHDFARLHVHGVVVVRRAGHDAVRNALTRAGGMIEDSRWAKKQLDMKPITNATGWTAYITKMRRWGKALPRGRHVFNSQQLKQMGMRHFEQCGLSKRLSFSKPRRKRSAATATVSPPM